MNEGEKCLSENKDRVVKGMASISLVPSGHRAHTYIYAVYIYILYIYIKYSRKLEFTVSQTQQKVTFPLSPLSLALQLQDG